MAIHPDDPPWNIFGLPRIITNKKNIERFLKLYDSPYNGLTLCSGSLGVDPNEDGMISQLKALGNLGILGRFIGMLTDSRSFVSYPRHEYFRRILCNLLGEWVESGRYPEDFDSLETIVRGISYSNAKEYFGF